MPCLKTRRIDKNKLVFVLRAHACDAVARGLCLARCDADFLPHQRIEQSRFAHVGLAHNGYQAAMLLAFGYGYLLGRFSLGASSLCRGSRIGAPTRFAQNFLQLCLHIFRQRGWRNCRRSWRCWHSFLGSFFHRGFFNIFQEVLPPILFCYGVLKVGKGAGFNPACFAAYTIFHTRGSSA